MYNSDLAHSLLTIQKSVVILTHLPFPALFSAVLARIAPSFFKYGYSALEVACHGIASWPDPCPDALLELPLLSEVLTVKLPDSTDNPQVAVGATKLRGEPEPVSSRIHLKLTAIRPLRRCPLPRPSARSRRSSRPSGPFGSA